MCWVTRRLRALLALEPAFRPVDADTRLVVATARPAPGNKADAHVRRNSGLPDRPLPAAEEADNAEYSGSVHGFEHAIGRLKNSKILRDCRRHGDGLHHAVQAVAHMHNGL